MKFRVSGDLRVPFVVEVEADSLEQAEERVANASYGSFMRGNEFFEANVDTTQIDVEIQDSEEIES